VVRAWRAVLARRRPEEGRRERKRWETGLGHRREPADGLRVAYPQPGVELECQTLLSTRFALDEELPVLDYESFPWR